MTADPSKWTLLVANPNQPIDGPFLMPAGASPLGGIPNVTWSQFVMLVYNELVTRNLTVSGGSGGSGVDPVPLIENHRVDSTDVHGISNTNALVLTSDARLSNARTPVAHAHAESDVTDLITDIAAKADAVHAHSEANVTNLVNDLAGKAASVHSHDAAYYTKAQVDALLAAATSGIPAALSWQPYPLANGWRNYPAVSGDTTYGNPQYCRLGALVFLRGVIEGLVATGPMAPLPVDCRPIKKQRLRLGASTGNYNDENLDMNPDGIITTPAGSDLHGLSFLVLRGFYDVTP